MGWATHPSPMHFDSLKIVPEHLVERIKLEDTIFRDSSQNAPGSPMYSAAALNAVSFNSWGIANQCSVNGIATATTNGVSTKVQTTNETNELADNALNRHGNRAPSTSNRNMNNSFMSTTMFLMNECLQQNSTHQSHLNAKKHDIFNIACEKGCNCDSTNSLFRAGNSLMFGADKHVGAKHFMTPCGPLQLTAQECGEFLLKKASVTSNLLGPDTANIGQQPVSAGNTNTTGVTHIKGRPLEGEATDDTQSSNNSNGKLTITTSHNLSGGHRYRLDKERPFSCPECGKSFLLKHHLVTHARVHTGERPHVCPECGKSFAHKHCLSTHLLLHSSERPYKCLECKKSFTLKHHLVTHARVHSRDRPFICQECGRTFPQKRHLVTHSKFHSGERPFVCDECGESFSQKDHLVIHSRFHGGLHPYVCPDCGSTFTRKFELVNHGRLHGRVPHSCEVCGKEFLQKRTLLAHTRLHTGDDRPFVCQHCGEAFSRKPELVEHSKIHTGDKPFVCSCCRSFSDKMSDLPDVDVDWLISAVQSKPVLWDKTCEKYKDKFKMQEAWKDVCVEIFDDFDESDVSKNIELGKHVLKKWTQVRDSYRKSISKTKEKSGAGASKAKAYIYASQFQFVNKIFKERETEDTLSQNINDNDGGVADITVENDENTIQSVPSIPRYAAAAEKPESSFKKPASKKRKMDDVELEMIAAPKETPNRHLSCFKGLLPSLDDFDEFDTLDFQMDVLQVVKKIRQRKHPLPSTSGTPYASPSSTPPMASSSATPPMVPNQYIQSQPNPQHITSAYLKPIHSQVSAVQFYEDSHNLGLNCRHSSTDDSSEYVFHNL